MSLAGDDGKGKSALCGGRRKLMAVEQIVLPSPSDPIMGRPASTPKRSANPAGLPNAQRRRPEELAFSLARIEKPRRKAAVREAFHACTCVRR